MTTRHTRAFTLIELLIVIAIIAILALIAVPNFLEAQIRAKVSAVMSDQRSIATALEAYAVDWGAYPICVVKYHIGKTASVDRGGIHQVTPLTTPVGYIGSVNFRDPFVPKSMQVDQLGNVAGTEKMSIHYCNTAYYQVLHPNSAQHWALWGLISLGPDYKKGPKPNGNAAGISDYAKPNSALSPQTLPTWTYDSSNGTISGGDIFRWQN